MESTVIDLCGNLIACVFVCVHCIVGVIQGFLWVRHLQVVLVLQQVQQFQVVRPLPSLRALHEDPANSSRSITDATNDATNESVKAHYPDNSDQVFGSDTHLLSRLPSNSRWSGLAGLSLSSKTVFLLVLKLSLIQLFLWTSSKSYRNIASMLVKHSLSLYLLSNRSRITQTTGRTLRTLKTTQKPFRQKKKNLNNSRQT